MPVDGHGGEPVGRRQRDRAGRLITAIDSWVVLTACEQIDRPLVSVLDHDDSATAIVHMGHTLGLDIVAKGVETGTQADLLQTLGCDAAQPERVRA
ncbi:EAL domain-containing protein [Dactylosporangium sp. CA-092794]|uniref:EAL domain-containing protein n=1 Tax=Dactylosporangium sp. CA-092794 TaxID=3239929 RepID=UPI003D8D7040